MGKTLKFDGVTGAARGQAQLLGPVPSFGNSLTELVAPLHFGNFGGFWSRLNWAGLGAAMAYTVVTGVQLWMRRRDQERVWQTGDLVLQAVVWGSLMALIGAAYGFFLARLGGETERWTANGFLLASALALMLVWLWRRESGAEVANRLRSLLGLSLLGLSLLALQTGGLSWGEALVFGGADVLLIEAFCLGSGGLCLWLSRRARQVTDLGQDMLRAASQRGAASPAE